METDRVRFASLAAYEIEGLRFRDGVRGSMSGLNAAGVVRSSPEKIYMQLIESGYQLYKDAGPQLEVEAGVVVVDAKELESERLRKKVQVRRCVWFMREGACIIDSQ